MSKAILEITMKVADVNRPKAGEIYARYKCSFLANVPGAVSKELLLREEDVQVLHRFESRAAVHNYLASRLFSVDVVEELKPLLMADPEIRIYEHDA